MFMASFTKKAIIASFLKFLNEKPLSKITVKDIVEDCGINRNSFYYHFEDLPSLAEAVLMEDAAKIVEQAKDLTSFEDCLTIALDMALKNKRAVMHLYQSQSRESFERYLNKIAEFTAKEYIHKIARGYDVSSADKEIIIHYYKCQLIGFVLDWLNSGMDYYIQQNIKRLCELFSGATQTAFLRSAENE